MSVDRALQRGRTRRARSRTRPCFWGPQVNHALAERERFVKSSQTSLVRDPHSIIVHYCAPEGSLSPSMVWDSLRHGQRIPLSAAIELSGALIAKSGRESSRVVEANSMLFVQQHTKIPVPWVHLVFTRGATTFVVIDEIKGRCLQGIWPNLSATEREDIMLQLASYLEQLRRIQPSSNISPGSLQGGRCQGPYFRYGAGPFTTVDALVSWMETKLRRPSIISQASYPLVFTHQDIAPRNLILGDDGRLWVIDWEMAGW